MLSVGLSMVTALMILCISYWTYKWKNPECSGKLPPGSMGFPLIGETLQYLLPSNSIDIPTFIQKRKKKYGLVFRTSLVGQKVVISNDPDFNHFLLQQEGKLVEFWYLGTFAKLFGFGDSSDESAPNSSGYIHKYIRNTVITHFGIEALKQEAIPRMEQMANRALHDWSNQKTVELKLAFTKIIFDFTSKELFGYDPEKSGQNLSDKFLNFLEGLMAFPLNIPGTAFHRCMQNQKEMFKMMRNMIEERKASPEKRRGDILDTLIDDLGKEKFVSENFLVYFIFGLVLASFENISSTLTLAINLLTEQPLLVQELEKENEEILRNRESGETELTWKEYKSMKFTMQVINESLRMASVSPGMLRRAIKDIHINGYTIPKGWILMFCPSAIHMNPDTYKDPLVFDPSRWKDMGANVASKNFMAFGGGMRSCAGAEFSKLLMAVFLHVLVTKYRWTKVKGAEIRRAPVLGFGKGYYVNFSEKLK